MVLVTASLAALLALFSFQPWPLGADIFQWQYINPRLIPARGKQPSTMLCPGGAGSEFHARARPLVETANLTMGLPDRRGSLCLISLTMRNGFS